MPHKQIYPNTYVVDAHTNTKINHAYVSHMSQVVFVAANNKNTPSHYTRKHTQGMISGRQTKHTNTRHTHTHTHNTN